MLRDEASHRIADGPVLLVGHSYEEWLSRRQNDPKVVGVGVWGLRSRRQR